MTTGGEGGMVTTNDEAFWRDMWAYKDHGKSYAAVYECSHPPGFRWLHESIGTNWRMLEMQAAIGRIQLQHMAQWSQTRQRYANHIWETCARFPLFSVPKLPSSSVHACYKVYVYVRTDHLAEGWSRDQLIEAITAEGVPCYQGSCSEVYLEKAFDSIPGRPDYRLPNAKVLGETSMMFLVHPTLSPSEIAKTCRAIENVVQVAGE